jgi:PAS domain S-box-containing protein
MENDQKVDAADKSVEEKLRESEEKYHSIFNRLVDIYYQADAQGLITTLSPSCFNLSGWKPEELVGSQILKLYSRPEERKVFMEKLLKDGAVTDYEVTLLHHDGHEIPVSISSRVVKNEQGNFHIEGLVRDITDRKKMEEELKKSKDDLSLKVDELEKLNNLMTDREIKMIELKKELSELKQEVVELRGEIEKIKKGV